MSSYAYIFYDRQFGDYPTDDQRGDPATLPPTWLSQIQDIAPGVPYGFTETGWIAEDYDVDGDGPGAYVIKSDAARQEAYVRMMLEEAEQLDFAFIVWFSLADFDPLWFLPLEQGGMAGNPFALTWLKTGLFDNSADTIEQYDSEGVTLTPRPGFAVWEQWLSRPVR